MVMRDIASSPSPLLLCVATAVLGRAIAELSKMNADNPARPYPIGTVARMVLLVVGLGYMAVGGCWVWVNREYAALMVVAFGFLPLAAVCWHSRLMVRGFLIGCCLSVFLLALQFTRALFGEYKTSIHPIFWAFPVLATPLPLGFWILVRWLDQDQPWVPKSPPAFPLKLSESTSVTSIESSTPIPSSAAALEPETKRGRS